MKSLLLAVTLATLGLMTSQNPAAASPPTPCTAIAALEPQTGHTMPPQAPVLFASDFPVTTDCEWGYTVGGFGGHHQGDTLHHIPVIFVHGNQADAENWFLVSDQFKQQGGYSDQELYALSYNGLENGSAGLPTCCQPAPESTKYWSNQCLTNTGTLCQGYPPSPGYAFCCNGGHGASDDSNTLDLYNFILAVQQYTGSLDFDVVAHSLGVTITRKLLVQHPELRQHVLAAVMIAGANRGTSVCRGISGSYYGCDEISPVEALPPGATTTGDPTPSNGWLYNLNAAGESPGPTRWMSVYNGSDTTDPFFSASPGVFDDTGSPHLAGAVNVTCSHTYHNDLRVRSDIVQTYLNFLLQNGQTSGALATVSGAPVAQFPCAFEQPAALLPETPHAALLILPAIAGVAVVAIGRRRRLSGPTSPRPS